MKAQAVDGRIEELIRKLRGCKRLLVLTHANPDPDSLASAQGLRLLAEAKLGVPSSFGYTGRILRAENKEMVEHCGIEMTPLEELDLDSYDCLAVVDTQPGFGHTQLPEDLKVDIVIDHHMPPDEPNGQNPDCFEDVRTYVGATCSMVTGYLMDAGVEIPANVATALFYGIKTDTADLSRNVSPLDEKAYEHLVVRMNRQSLAKITKPDLSAEYFKALRVALNGVRLYGDVVLCSLGQTTSPEMIAEVADLLLRLEGKQTVFCGGMVGKIYYMSVRTELDRDAYSLIKAALDGEGSFGGHGSMAGGSLELKGDDRRSLKRWERRLEKNILKIMGVEGVAVSGIGGDPE